MEEELEKQKRSALRKIKPYIRALLNNPDLFRKVTSDFELNSYLTRILKSINNEKYHSSRYSVNDLYNELSRNLENQHLIQKLEKLFKNKKDYIIKLIEREHEKSLNIITKVCFHCGTKVKTNRNSCSVCRALYKT